jgi:hypothetical protein
MVRRQVEDPRTDAEVDAEVEQNMARGRVHLEKLMNGLADERDPVEVAYDVWLNLIPILTENGWGAKELKEDVTLYARPRRR